MGIVVTRDPYVVVTDEETGWSLAAGRITAYGELEMMPMTRPGAMPLEVRIEHFWTTDEGVLSIFVYFADIRDWRRAKEREASWEHAFIASGEADAVAARLLRAWYRAQFKVLPTLTIRIWKSRSA